MGVLRSIGRVFQLVRLNDEPDYRRLISGIDLNIVDEDSQNLLHEAIAHQATLIGLDLISKGINLAQQDKNGQTPLHYAAQYGNNSIANAILEKMADVNIRDRYGNNALWTAVFNARGNYEVVKTIVTHGGDAMTKNKSNRSPLDFATQINDKALIEMLLKNKFYLLMKKLLKLVSLAFFLAVISCSDDNDGTPSQRVTAKIDGATYNAIAFTGTYNANGTSQVVATDTNGDYFSFVISKSATTGTYELGTATSIAINFYKKSGVVYVAEQGEFILTEFTSSRFEGTFNFTGPVVSGGTTGDITVEQGVVEVDLVEQ